jgi:hypothetical protein
MELELRRELLTSRFPERLLAAFVAVGNPVDGHETSNALRA